MFPIPLFQPKFPVFGGDLFRKRVHGFHLRLAGHAAHHHPRNASTFRPSISPGQALHRPCPPAVGNQEGGKPGFWFQ